MKIEYATGDAYPSQTCRAYSTGRVKRRFFSNNAWGEWNTFSDDATVLGNLSKTKIQHIVQNRSLTITIPQYSSFIISAGLSVDNSLLSLYTGSANNSGIYSFNKVTGESTSSITAQTDGFDITFTANSYIDVFLISQAQTQ